MPGCFGVRVPLSPLLQDVSGGEQVAVFQTRFGGTDGPTASLRGASCAGTLGTAIESGDKSPALHRRDARESSPRRFGQVTSMWTTRWMGVRA